MVRLDGVRRGAEGARRRAVADADVRRGCGLSRCRGSSGQVLADSYLADKLSLYRLSIRTAAVSRLSDLLAVLYAAIMFLVVARYLYLFVHLTDYLRRTHLTAWV